MPAYQITQTTSGVVLGNFLGATPDEALDAMARDQGYKSYRDMCSITDPEDLDAEVEKQRSTLLIKAR